MMHRDPMAKAPAATSPSAAYDRYTAADVDLDVAAATINQNATFDGVEGYAYNRSHPAASTEQQKRAVDDDDEETPLKYLDMDVIDTTWMDNNVHAIRHNYFNINPTLVRVIGK